MVPQTTTNRVIQSQVFTSTIARNVLAHSMIDKEELADKLKSEVGDDLRTFGIYGRNVLDFLYLREDVDIQYSDDDYRRISELFVLQDLEVEYLEELFALGDLEFVAYGFDSGVIYHFVSGTHRGFFLSVNRGASVDIETVRRMIEGSWSDSGGADDLQELFNREG